MFKLTEGMKKRLQEVGRALSGSNVPLVLSSRSQTDFNKVFINLNIPWAKTEAEWWLALSALRDHEFAHVRYTSKHAWLSYIEWALKENKEFLADSTKGLPSASFAKDVLNILEDARVERAWAIEYPGTAARINYLNAKSYENVQPARSVQALSGALWCLATIGDIHPNFQLTPEEFKLVMKCRPYVMQARQAGNTEGAVKCAIAILHITRVYMAKKYKEYQQMYGDSVPGTERPFSSPGTGEPLFRKRVTYRPVEEELEEKSEETSQLASQQDRASDNNKEVGDRDEPDEPDEPGEPDELDEHAKESGGSVEPDEYAGEANGSDEPDEYGEPASDFNKPSGFEEPDELEGSGEPSGSDESKGPSDEFNSGEAERDASNDSSSDSLEKNDEVNEEDAQEEQEEQKPQEGRPEEDGLPVAGDEDWEADKGVAEQNDDSVSDLSGESIDSGDLAKDVENEPLWEEDVDDYGEIDEEKLEELFQNALEDAANELHEITEAELRDENISFRKKEQPLEVGVHEKIELVELSTANDIRNYFCYNLEELPSRETIVNLYKKQIMDLGREIKESLLYRKHLPERHLRRGQLDSGGLWRVAVGDYNIFRKRKKEGTKSDVTFFILVDASGSMRGDGSQNAKIATVVSAEALKLNNLPFAVEGFSTATRENTVVHFIYKKFEDPALCETIDCYSGVEENRDGYSIRVAGRSLLRRSERKKVLIVLSDGLPSHTRSSPPYYMDVGVQDTILAVREMQRSGILVVGIYFGSGQESFCQRIYPNLVICEPTNLPNALGSVLKRVLRS